MPIKKMVPKYVKLTEDSIKKSERIVKKMGLGNFSAFIRLAVHDAILKYSKEK